MPTKRSHERKMPKPSKITLAPVPKPKKKIPSEVIAEMERQPMRPPSELGSQPVGKRPADWEHLENSANWCAGFNEAAVDKFINDAEAMDKGLTRHPWPAKFKAKLKKALKGKTTLVEMRDVLNKMVVEDLGGGINDRGPFSGGPLV